MSDTPVFKLDAFHGPLTADEMADVLDTLADMIRDGFTSGDANGVGWWDVSGLSEPVVYESRVTDDGAVVIITGDDEEIVLTAWDDEHDTQIKMEVIAERLNDGATLESAEREMEEFLTRLRLTRLGYDWTDDWDTGQQRWTLTGPDGAIPLPSGGFHGWSECVKVAVADADRKALDATPPA